MPERSIRETYDLPAKPPVPFRQYALMAVLPLAVLLAWFLLPKSAIWVAVLAVVTLAVVFLGVRMVLSSRALYEEPGRHPTAPPSTK